MWGSRARGKKRRPGFGNHTFSNVKEGVKWATQRLRKQKRERVIKLKDAITKLTESGSKLTRRRGDIHKRMNIAREIGKLKVELADVMDDKPCEEFVERVQPLLTEDTQENRQQCHVLYLNLFHPDKSAPLFVERDICPTCNTEYVMAATESKMICPSCGDTDNLVHSNTEFVDEAEPTKPAPEYERGPVYRKYLMQYHEDAPSPPPEVINIVYKHLSKVHIMLSTKVRPTPITQILREEKLQKWTPYAAVIAKHINNEHIVKLSQDLIDRLVERFNKLLKYSMDRKKSMNFEFLTRNFLSLEGRPEYQYFACHKTRDVLNHADQRLRDYSKELETLDDLSNWRVARSC